VGRLREIDALRGIAALLVVFHHALEYPRLAGSGAAAAIMDNITFGRFGVCLFFLISGFVVPFSFAGDHPIAGFAISRAFRLYPAYWLSMFVALAAAMAPLSAVPANLTMLQYAFGQPDMIGVYWTLAFELIFYAACAFLFWRGKLFQWAAPIAAIFLAASVGLSVASPDYGQLWPFAYLFTGTVIRQATLGGRWWPALALCAGLAVISPVIAGAFYPVGDAINPLTGPQPLILGMILPIPVFLAVAVFRPRAPGWAVFLGAISYSLYLFHLVIIRFAKEAIEPTNLPLFLVIVTAASILVAWAVYRGVELPGIALGKALRRRGLQHVEIAVERPGERAAREDAELVHTSPRGRDVGRESV
jgi:peptidoglycan/LPS O-acetylase OafA/YrhL